MNDETDAVRPDRLLQDGDEFNGMKVIAFCGGGGFGEVYYCEEIISLRRIALKIVPKNEPDGNWERELKGIRNYSRIAEQYPELLKIHRVKEEEKCFWYTMEPADSRDPDKYLPDTLAARLAKGPLPPEQLFPVLNGIFQCIRALQRGNLVHRDIKPDNVVFVNGKPKLADIGLCSSLSVTVTKLAGTPGFVPPETGGDTASDSSDRASRRRNDLYAFGKVIYCAVTGNDSDEFPSIPPEVKISLRPVKLFHALALRLCGEDPEHPIDSVTAAAKELDLIDRQLGNVFYRLGSSWRRKRLYVLLAAVCTLAVLSLILIVKPAPAGKIHWSEGKKMATLRLSPAVSLEMVRIPPGSFMMGSPAGERGRSKDEKQHQVSFTREYWLGKYEVTQSQWKAVMLNNPSRFVGGDFPVEQVSWNDAKQFCAKLNLLYADELRSLGYRFDLPTEAQWEYACRAGTAAALNNGRELESVWRDCRNLDLIAWYGRNSGQFVHEVGKKGKNAWGLYDMHGNIYEWCRDWYGPYQEDSVDDPVGPPDGRRKVRRGGSWSDAVPNSSHRSASRVSYPPDFKHRDTGFRLVLTPGDPAAR